MSVNINFTANDVSLIEGNQGARAQFIYQGKTYTLVQHYDISVTKDQAFRAMQKNIGTMLNLAEVSQLGVKTEKILVDHHDTFRRWKQGEVKECKVAQYLAKKGRPVVPIPHPRHVTDTSMLSATKVRRIERMHAKRDETSVLSGVGNRLRSVITTYDQTLLDAVHYGPEHMSQGVFSSNKVHEAFEQAMEETEVSRPDLFQQLKKAEEYRVAFYTIRHKGAGASSSALAKKIQRDVANLPAGQSVLIPIHTVSKAGAHATQLQLTKQENGSYRALYFNEGKGVTRYHHHYFDGTREQFQVALEISDISQDRLQTQFFENLVNYVSHEFSNKDRTEGFYKDILSKLGQTAPPREDDPRLWSRGQLGGSCAVRSTKAFLRANMTDQEYRRLKTELRMNHLLKVYREIKGGHADSLSYHVVALELVEQLKHTLVKHGETVPQELLRAETDIHERKARLHGVVKKTADGTFKGHFNLALEAYRSGDMVTAEKNLAQAYALRSRVRKQALRELSMTFIPNHMGDFQQPQTRQQVNFLFGVYRTIGRENIRGREAPFIGKVEQAYRDKHVAAYYPTSLWVEQGGEKEDVEPGEPLV